MSALSCTLRLTVSLDSVAVSGSGCICGWWRAQLVRTVPCRVAVANGSAWKTVCRRRATSADWENDIAPGFDDVACAFSRFRWWHQHLHPFMSSPRGAPRYCRYCLCTVLSLSLCLSESFRCSRMLTQKRSRPQPLKLGHQHALTWRGHKCSTV